MIKNLFAALVSFFFVFSSLSRSAEEFVIEPRSWTSPILTSANDRLAMRDHFILCFSMALPWPFVGAGLSFLSKPGKWVEYINYCAFSPLDVKEGTD